MIYIVVIAAVALIPWELGGYGAVFQAADAAFKAKGAGGLLLGGSQIVAYATLALGSALAAFMYPHTLTGIFASASANTIRKNAVLLPAYTLLLGLLALLGYMGHAAHLQARQPERRGAGAVPDAVPELVRRLRLRRHRHRRAGAGGGDEHRRRQPVHPQFLEGLCRPRHQPCRRGAGGQAHLAGGQGRRAAGDRVPADAVRARPAAARRRLDPADPAGAGVRPLCRLVPCARRCLPAGPSASSAAAGSSGRTG